MLYDASGRKIRRQVGFLRDYIVVREIQGNADIDAESSKEIEILPPDPGETPPDDDCHTALPGR